MFYALTRPRGFRNEVEIHCFATQQERDEWIHRFNLQPDLTADRRAEVITAQQAHHLLRLANEPDWWVRTIQH